MTKTEYSGQSPSLTDIQNLVGSTYLDIGLGLTTFEEDGVIVPSAAVADASQVGVGSGGIHPYPGDESNVNGPAMRLLQVALMRAGKLSASEASLREFRGNVVIATGDKEFLDAMRALFPQPTAP